MTQSYYCCLPESIYSIIKLQQCVISIKDQDLDIINAETNEIIASLCFGSFNERTEVVNVDGTSIKSSIPIKQNIEVSRKAFATRLKTQNIKPKEKIQLETLPFDSFTPIATVKNLSDNKIIREHIQATLEYIGDNFPSNENKIAGLTELSQFVLNNKLVKQQSNLQSMIESLKEAKRKKNIPEMKRALLVISNKI